MQDLCILARMYHNPNSTTLQHNHLNYTTLSPLNRPHLSSTRDKCHRAKIRRVSTNKGYHSSTHSLHLKDSLLRNSHSNNKNHIGKIVTRPGVGTIRIHSHQHHKTLPSKRL